MSRKWYLYDFAEKKQFKDKDFSKPIIVPEEEIYNKPGITAHLKYRKSTYRTSHPYGEYFAVVAVECEEDELYDIESLVLKITKQYHPCIDELPNNECRIGIHPEILIRLIIDTCIYYKVPYRVLRGAEIIQEIENDNFYYMNDPEVIKLEERLTNHTYFKKLYDFERKCKMPELRSFQIDAIEAIENVYADPAKHSIKTIMPCGTGKTAVFQEFAFRHQHEFRYIFYITYTLKLIENMIDRWKDIFPDRKFVELSSSKSKYHMDNEELTGHIDLGEKFVFFVCDESFRNTGIIFDYNIIEGAKDKCLFIWDEAHKLHRDIYGGNPLNIIRDPKFNILWEKQLIFNIFCTATPIYGNYKTDNPLYMNNPDYYGVDEYRFTDLEECIKAGFICDMQLIIKKDNFDISNRFVSQEYKDGIDENDEREIGEKAVSYAKHFKREIIVRCLNTLYSLLADTSLKYKPSKVIIYCTLKKEVNEFYNALQLMKEECELLREFELFKLYSDFDSGMDQSLRRFTNYEGKSIMINIRMLNDGINVPDIDTILFTNPITSKPDIIQRIFRARRALITRPDKMAYIIIPVSIYDIRDEMYSMVLKVLQELIEANDPSVIVLKKKYKERGEKTSGVKLIDDQNDSFDYKFMDPEIQHSIITDIGHLFRFTSLYYAILRTVQCYPMTVLEICDYINFNQLTTFVATCDACKNTCDGMVEHGKIFYDEKSLKYFSPEGDTNEQEKEFNEFLNKMSVLQITDETGYANYCATKDFTKVHFNPIIYFRKFKFNWDMIRPVEMKSYDFEVCKEVITKLLDDPNLANQIVNVNGYVKRIKLLREKDGQIPHQDKIKQHYKLKNMKELHKLLIEPKF